MTIISSVPKIILLAVHFAVKSDIDSLASLASRHDKVLQTELLLRILLTCLPDNLEPSQYVPLIERIESGNLDDDSKDVDWSSVEHFTDAEAAKKVRKLQLLPLASPDAPEDALGDPITLFLLHRAHRVDKEAGLLEQLPDLIIPFLNHSPCIRTWLISAILPLLRRNEYYPHNPARQTLSEFEHLNDRSAVSLLLERTGAREEDLAHVGRDLRGLIGPWLYSESRWKLEDIRRSDPSFVPENGAFHTNRNLCPGWEQMLEWLTTQASSSWKVAVEAFEQWDGPEDVDLGDLGSMWFGDDEQGYLEQRYARAALASAYLVPEASMEALTGVNNIITKIISLLDQDPYPTLQVASTLLAPCTDLTQESVLSAKNATLMRNNLLDESNILTAPTKLSTQILHALTLSAFILTKAGAPCTVRKAGELAFLQDEREQKAEAVKFICTLRNNAPKNDDNYWVRARNELLWLRDWGAEEASDLSSPVQARGVFGQLKKEFVEVECLKAFLSSGRYFLARSIYEDSFERPLANNILMDTIMEAAMNAYDNASNPNRTRGGLLKCDDIVHAFPQILPEKSAASRRFEALLKATHGLSKYRLVLKQGEPFTPVVLRVHSDPISIIGKVLEQNRESHTRLQEFLEIGANMVEAGLTSSEKSTQYSQSPEQISHQKSLVEKRVTSMCIDAALTEDDFETAYSYVVNRLTSISEPAQLSAANGPLGKGASAKPAPVIVDNFSWKAALQVGKYRCTARTVRPTHIGTSSGNPEIRHLEKRIECLSTALRIAPPATLQEILNVFRRCEEELDAAFKAEDEQESAWDDQGDVQAMPGAFSSTVPAGVRKHTRQKSRPQEEAPMSLFELSRASMARAQQNFNTLSNLQRSEQTRDDPHDEDLDASGQPRVRRRDQLREAAVGTLASGVGWLIGAQPVEKLGDRE